MAETFVTEISFGQYNVGIGTDTISGIKRRTIQIGTSAPITAIWNDSGGTPPSSTDWVRSGSNLIGTRTANTAFAARLEASIARTNGTVSVTINAIGTNTFGPAVGLDSGAETDYLGFTPTGQSIGYFSSGDIRLGSSVAFTGLATWTTGDIIKVVKAAAVISFYKNGVLIQAVNTADPAYFGGATPPVGLTSYPAVYSGNGTGMQVTLDASIW